MQRRFKIGDRVAIECKGITVTGTIGPYPPEYDPTDDTWSMNVIDENTALPHYWKQAIDGGTVAKA